MTTIKFRTKVRGEVVRHAFDAETNMIHWVNEDGSIGPIAYHVGHATQHVKDFLTSKGFKVN